MERRFKQVGSRIERKPSGQAWSRLESKLDADRRTPIRRLNPVWLAAACLIVAVLSLPYLLNQSGSTMDMTAFHPSFTIEDVDLTSASTSNLSVHELNNAYKKLNVH